MTIDEKGAGHFYKHEALSASLASQVMSRLKYDNHTREKVTTVIQNHGIVFQPTPKQARRLLNKLGVENLRLLIQLELADVKSQNPIHREQRVSNIQAFEQVVEEVLKAEQCFSIRHLALKGGDLLLMGIPQGPEIGKVLHGLLERVIDGSLPNEKEALSQAVREHLPNCPQN